MRFRFLRAQIRIPLLPICLAPVQSTVQMNTWPDIVGNMWLTFNGSSTQHGWILPREVELWLEWKVRSGWSVKRCQCSNRLATVLHENIPSPISPAFCSFFYPSPYTELLFSLFVWQAGYPVSLGPLPPSYGVGGGQMFFRGSNHSQIYLHMNANFVHGPTVVSKKWGYRQTHTSTNGRCSFI